MTPEAPTPKYVLTVKIMGNSHDEIERSLSLLDADYVDYSRNHTADAFHRIGPRLTAELTHANPEQTPEGFAAELDAWVEARRAARRPISGHKSP